MRRLLGLTAAAVTTVLVLPVPAASAAEDVDAGANSGSANYACSLTAAGRTDVSVTMSLVGVPESVAPGQTIRLSGTVTFGFTTQAALLTALLLANKVGVSSASFALDAATADSTDTIEAVAVQGGQTPISIGEPFTLSANVVLPDYTVPDDASGDVVLSLPSEAKLPNPAATAPMKVAFTAVLNEPGLVGQRDLGCALADTDTTPLIARIPIDASGTVVPGDAGSGLGAGPGLGDSGLSVPDSAAGLDAGAHPPTAPPDTQAPAAVEDRPVFAAIPPSTRHGGVFIPAWSIAILGLVVPVAAVIYALLLRRRMRLMQLTADGVADARGTSRTRSRS